ncbi:MAG: Bug family tripartite tricarboxylate transporter substrate binding protein [Reyranellaceae bacterium]
MLLAALLALAALSPHALAQDAYPSRPIRIIVGFPPGGIADTLARLVGDALSQQLKATVVVESRPGAGGLAGAEACARAAPDGHTFCIGSAPVHSLHAHLRSQPLNWDPQTAFAPVAMLATEPTVVAVSPKIGVGNPAAFVEWLRRNPETAYSTSGAGTSSHLLGAAIGHQLGLRLEHIPYRGSQQAIMAVIAGDVPMVVAVAGGLVPFVQKGELVAIGVSSAAPSPLLPDAPPLSQSVLPQLSFSNYQGLFAPAATPQPLIERIAATINAAFADPARRETIVRLGLEPVFGTPGEFAAWLRESSDDWKALVELSGAAKAAR